MTQRRPDRTLRPVDQEFWYWCDQSELRLQQCAQCQKVSWPPVETCEHCGDARLTWTRMSGDGEIASGCTFERDYYNAQLPMPWETILVALDEGPLFISNPYDLTWQEISPGMRVKVRFVACEDSAGVFRLPIFERAEARGP